MFLKYLFFLFLFFFSCSSTEQVVYLNDTDKLHGWSTKQLNFNDEKISIGDILKIDVLTLIPEASQPYNKVTTNSLSTNNIEIMKLEGYIIDNDGNINFPVLGKIECENLSFKELSKKITELLISGNHLLNPIVNVRRLNSKFTILGEVRNPGTFSYYEKYLNIFQAIGYAGDFTIDGKKNDIKLIRSENGIQKLYRLELSSSEILKSKFYNIQNNDVIIVNPSFSKRKSAGFIGSPSSIASMASLLLSITLLIINN